MHNGKKQEVVLIDNNIFLDIVMNLCRKVQVVINIYNIMIEKEHGKIV